MKEKTVKIFNVCSLLIYIAAFIFSLVSLISGTMFPKGASENLGEAIGDSCKAMVMGAIVIFALFVHAITVIVFSVAMIFGEKKTAAGAFVAVFCALSFAAYTMCAVEYAGTYDVKPDAFSVSGFAALCFSAACALLCAATGIITAVTHKNAKRNANLSGASDISANKNVTPVLNEEADGKNADIVADNISKDENSAGEDAQK